MTVPVETRLEDLDKKVDVFEIRKTSSVMLDDGEEKKEAHVEGEFGNVHDNSNNLKNARPENDDDNAEDEYVETDHLDDNEVAEENGDDGVGCKEDEHKSSHAATASLLSSRPLPFQPALAVDRHWLQKLLRKAFPDKYGHLSRPVPIVLAPMVDQSDLPFRLLCRRYGVNVCFTPMIHAKLWSESVVYRRKFGLRRTPDMDRPLIAQICGSDPVQVVQAALDCAPYCDGIDLNCGCPQQIAKRGKYGAFLLEQPDALLRAVRALVQYVPIPISVKVRLLPPPLVGNPVTGVPHVRPDAIDLDRSLALYRQLVHECKIHLLTIHGRTRLQKGRYQTRANWGAIRQVVQDLGSTIPILANGSIETTEQAIECWEQTTADGIMSSEALLEYPALFDELRQIETPEGTTRLIVVDRRTGEPTTVPQRRRPRAVGRLRLTKEYLQLAHQYPPDRGGQGSGIKCMRVHVHRFLHADLQVQHDQVRRTAAQQEQRHDATGVGRTDLTQRAVAIRKQIIDIFTWEGLWHACELVQQIQNESNHDYSTEQLSWYRRHRRPVEMEENNDNNDDDDADGVHWFMNNPSSKVKSVELADDAADCFACLFGDEEE